MYAHTYLHTFFSKICLNYYGKVIEFTDNNNKNIIIFSMLRSMTEPSIESNTNRLVNILWNKF